MTARPQPKASTHWELWQGDTATDYSYDKRGNLISEVINGQPEASYTFDARNQLVAVSNQLGSASYSYDGFRNRVKKLENFQQEAATIPDPTKEVRYVLDMTLPYDNLLATHGAESQSFVWGNSLLSGTGASTFYYLQDHLGSPVRLLGDGSDYEALTYDEFGVPDVDAWHKTNNFSNPFGFTGYQVDDVNGLQYAQARYYNPNIGRFGAEDPIKDLVNWYGYCGANPVNLIDPSGLVMSGEFDGSSQSSTTPRPTPVPVETPGSVHHPGSVQPSPSSSPSSVGVPRLVIVDVPGSVHQQPYLAQPGSLPSRGIPDSTGLLRNPDGSIKQGRTYGSDRRAVRDRDFNHSGEGHVFPHDHEWDWSKVPPRQRGVPVPEPTTETEPNEPKSNDITVGSWAETLAIASALGVGEIAANMGKALSRAAAGFFPIIVPVDLLEIHTPFRPWDSPGNSLTDNCLT